MPLLTVIIPTYNRAILLAEALKSLRIQEFSDFEVIVVDDGSTDDTPAVLARFAEGEPPGRFRVLRQANAGQGAARNLAIGAAHGEYCLFLDSDDVFFPWSLAIVAEAIAENGHPSVVLGQEKAFMTDAEFAAIPREPLKLAKYQDLYTFAMQHRLGPCGIAVAKTNLLREIGGFTTERMVGEDADLMLRLGVAPKMVKIEAPGLYGYRVHPHNFVKNHEAWYRGACHFIRQYRAGGFPGGTARATEIRKLAGDAVSLYCLATLYYGGRWACLDVYVRTIWWQFRAGNRRDLLKTPFLLVKSALGLWPTKEQRLLNKASAARRAGIVANELPAPTK